MIINVTDGAIDCISHEVLYDLVFIISHRKKLRSDVFVPKSLSAFIYLGKTIDGLDAGSGYASG